MENSEYLRIADALRRLHSSRSAASALTARARYGHIAIGVDDLDGTLARLAEQGIEPERPPYQVREGGSWLCFVRDPDDYRIEIIGRS